MTATVVLVHGAFHGGWCWEPVVRALDRRGVPAVAVTLPYSCWQDDVRALRDAVRSVRGTVLLVGHSLGGAIVCAVGDEPAVARLGFVSALVVDPDETVRDRLARRGVAEHLRDGADPAVRAAMSAGDDGNVRIAPGAAGSLFYSDCRPEEVARAVSRLRPISASSLTGRPTAAPWRDKPASYLFCTEDRAVPMDVQEAYAEGLRGHRDRLDASHSPFWSRPSDVAGVLERWAAETAETAETAAAE
ncbi:alpha/beta fold hydrolase [Phytohabitans suffuscus]|uniref:alpha/beta fold hydrolase n=1 Tax=Phytohabitans suffuscus TaxID=624315 RepID=UPI00156384AB|nr:alpha/beta fold hydrolase [Phytohabitans suffuscus]